MQPQISIVMPIYNSSLYLKESIESVLNQTFEDFEFIIIDDGSTDNSFDIIKTYQDKRINLQGLNHDYIGSLNHGMRLAKGKYIVRMDSDDKMLPYRLQKQFNFMESNPEITVCGCWFQTFGINNNIYQLETKHDDIICNMLSGNPMCHPSVIMRADILSSIFYNKGKDIYDKSFIYAEDYKLWYDIIKEGQLLANIPEVLMLYRCSDKQSSRKECNLSFKAALKVRMAYLKDVCRWILLKDSTYLSRLEELFDLHENNKINFFKLCDCIKNIYQDILRNNSSLNI